MRIIAYEGEFVLCTVIFFNALVHDPFAAAHNNICLAVLYVVDVRVTVGNDTAVDDIIGPDEPSDLSAGIQLTRTNKQAARVSNFFMPISQRGWLVV